MASIVKVRTVISERFSLSSRGYAKRLDDPNAFTAGCFHIAGCRHGCTKQVNEVGRRPLAGLTTACSAEVVLPLIDSKASLRYRRLRKSSVPVRRLLKAAGSEVKPLSRSWSARRPGSSVMVAPGTGLFQARCGRPIQPDGVRSWWRQRARGLEGPNALAAGSHATLGPGGPSSASGSTAPAL